MGTALARSSAPRRATVERLLWDEDGERRVPSAAALDRAVSTLARGDLERICEFNPFGPVYFIPTAPFLRALARLIRARGARRALEVAAGDGHLTRALSAHAPDLRIVASDSGKWERPHARMSPRERRELRGTAVSGIRPGSDVVRLDARAAIDRFRPDLVLACWLPPGPLLGRILRASDRDVIEIGAGSGITGDISCWRYEHEFCDELDALGRCRLDERPARKLHTRVTLYQARTR
ncbi:MAG: hypothetical protein E6J64_19285 [Deltaproteobacteria bacterium]|nr:MAG: hypothetical protein E6J64_19285 [Deltaproteobacteria bacterium]